MSEIVQYVVSGLSSGSVSALLALGFVLVHRVTGVINLAQGSTAMLGGLLVALLVNHGWSFWAAAPLAVLLVAFGSLGLGALILGRSNTSELGSLMLALAAVISLQAVALLCFGDEPLSYPSPIGSAALTVFGAHLRPLELVMVVLALAIIPGTALLLSHTFIGTAMQACASNPRGARVCGIEIRTMGLMSFALAGAIGAVVGVLITPLGSMSFHSDLDLGIAGFVAASIGGLDSPRGALAGGFALGITLSLVAGLLNPAYQTAAALLVLLVVLIHRPRGLFGGLHARA